MTKSKYYSVPFWKKLNPFRKRYKAVICISGGAGWCMAYWGALWFLRHQGVEPVGFVTRSSGGFVALSYAFNWSDKHARDYYGSFRLNDFFKTRPSAPLFDPEKYKQFTGKYSKDMRLEDLRAPIYMAAANWTEHRVEYLHKDITVTDALTATTAIPGLIGPIEIGVNRYFDGEVLPGNDISVAKEIFGDYPIIQIERQGSSTMISALVGNMTNFAKQVFRVKSDFDHGLEPDYRLGINEVLGSPFSTDFIDQNVALGYEAAKSQWDQMKTVLQ